MVWSSGLTPAALIRTRILPAVTRGRGTSTSFRAPYPVNDSARIALILAPPRNASGSVVGERNDVPSLLRRRRGCKRGKGERAEVEQRGASERKVHGFRRRPAVEGGGEHGDAQGRADLTARIEHRAADARQRRGHAGQDRGVHRGRDQGCPKAGERQQGPLHEEGCRDRQLREPHCTGGQDGEPADDRRARSVATSQSPRGDAQPRADRSISAQVKAASPNAPTACAPRSNPFLADTGLRCTKRSASRTPTTPIGTLMRKMLRHPNAWMRAPPTNGPLAPVTAVRLLQMPIARARSTGSG